MKPVIAVIAEHHEDELNPVTFELWTCAEQVQAHHPLPLHGVVLGTDTTAAGTLARATGQPVTAIQDPNLDAYNPEAYLSALESFFRELPAAYVIMAHSVRGWELAPRLSVRLNASCITAVEEVTGWKNRPSFSRISKNGRMTEDIVGNRASTVLTVQPGFFPRASHNAARPGTVHLRVARTESGGLRALGPASPRDTLSALSDAHTIVAVGRGIGKSENLELVRRLTALFPNACMAASRPLCDAGWLDYRMQVGLTGNTVSPKLYLALGISGANQHVCGMKDSQFIVSVNRDPEAAIFRVSDVVIVEDLPRFIHELCTHLENS